MSIIGNCQVRPIADALRMIFPDDLIIDICSWDFSDEAYTREAMAYLRSLDVQVRMPLVDSPLSTDIIGHAEGQLVIEIPSLTFPAFHPDLVYALGPGGGLFRGPADFHSAIGLWAWCRGATVDQAVALFTDAVFAELHYDDYWDASVTSLREAFDSSDIEFGAFWRNLQRVPLFMHTVNHPTTAAIAAFSKAIAVRLGATADVWGYPLERYLTDYCLGAIWPVYPLVGRRLGIPGAWQWRLDDKQYLGISAWLSLCFAAYEGTDPADVVCHRFVGGLYDEVLGPRLDALSGARV